MPSWHPLTQTGLRFGIRPALGRSSRLLGMGNPSRIHRPWGQQEPVPGRNRIV